MCFSGLNRGRREGRTLRASDGGRELKVTLHYILLLQPLVRYVLQPKFILAHTGTKSEQEKRGGSEGVEPRANERTSPSCHTDEKEEEEKSERGVMSKFVDHGVSYIPCCWNV